MESGCTLPKNGLLSILRVAVIFRMISNGIFLPCKKYAVFRIHFHPQITPSPVHRMPVCFSLENRWSHLGRDFRMHWPLSPSRDAVRQTYVTKPPPIGGTRMCWFQRASFSRYYGYSPSDTPCRDKRRRVEYGDMQWRPGGLLMKWLPSLPTHLYHNDDGVYDALYVVEQACLAIQLSLPSPVHYKKLQVILLLSQVSYF